MNGAAKPNTGAMILAAGLGTRLRPLTEILPKPLVPIGDRAAIAHLLGALRGASFARVVVNAHHLASDLERLAAEDPSVVVSLEDELLGTAGGVRRAVDRGLLAGERALVVNGDLFADLPLAELAVAELAAASKLLVAPARGQGNVGVDGRGRVVRMRLETVAPGEVAAYDYLGCALLGAESLRALPTAGCLVGDVFLPLLRAGAALEVHPFAGAWLDVGSLAAYLAANLAWLGLRDAFVGSEASVEGATLERSVVGARARVEPGARLERCVVWPGVHVPAGEFHETVFAPGLAPIAVAAR